MKNLVIAFALTLLLTACADKPMSDADMAAKYGLSMEEYQEQKEAAARMNMTIEDHLNMGHEDHGDMDHGFMDHGFMDHGESDHEMDHGEHHHDEIQEEIDAMSDEEKADHEAAAEKMGMTLEEHIESGHAGH